MKSGITGWALINGRNNLSWSERIKLDIWYIDHWSLLLDIRILFKTIWVVSGGEGLYAEKGRQDKIVESNWCEVITRASIKK